MDQWIKAILDGGDVKRYHTTNLIKPQDVAQHSYRCALLAEHFSRHVKYVRPEKVMLHMLIHDIPETGIGDVPFGVKRTFKDLYSELNKAEECWCHHMMPEEHYDNMFFKGFSVNEIAVCKFVDQYEALLKSMEEIRMGNKNLIPMFENMVQVCSDMIDRHECLFNLRLFVDELSYGVE